MNKNSIITLLLALFTSILFMPGCAVTQKTPEDVIARMTENRDDYDKSTILTTPQYYKPSDKGIFANEVGHNAYLKCYIYDKSRTYSIILRVVYSGSTWAFLDRATDSNGLVLPTTAADRHVVSGSLIRENLNIDLSKSYLESHVQTGFDIKLSGHHGSMILKYPPQYIEGFLTSIEPRISGYRESK
jgi:hypothetical protein